MSSFKDVVSSLLQNSSRLQKSSIEDFLKDERLGLVFRFEDYRDKKTIKPRDKMVYFGSKHMRCALSYIIYQKYPRYTQASHLTNIRKRFETVDARFVLYNFLKEAGYIDCITFSNTSTIGKKHTTEYYDIIENSWYAFIYLLDNHFKDIGMTVIYTLLYIIYKDYTPTIQVAVERSAILKFNQIGFRPVQVKECGNIMNSVCYIENEDRWTTVLNYNGTVIKAAGNTKVESYDKAIESIVTVEMYDNYFKKNSLVERDNSYKPLRDRSFSDLKSLLNEYTCLDVNNHKGKDLHFDDTLSMMCNHSSVDNKFNYEWLEFFGDLFYGSFVCRYIEKEFPTLESRVWIHEIYSLFTSGSEKSHFQIVLSDNLFNLSSLIRIRDRRNLETNQKIKGDLFEALFGLVTLLGNKPIDRDVDTFMGYHIGYNFFKNIMNRIEIDKSIFTPRFLKRDQKLLEESFQVLSFNGHVATNIVDELYIIPKDKIPDIGKFTSIRLQPFKPIKKYRSDIEYYSFSRYMLKSFIDICIENNIILLPKDIYDVQFQEASISKDDENAGDAEYEEFESTFTDLTELDTSVKVDSNRKDDEKVDFKDVSKPITFYISDESGFDTRILRDIFLNNNYQEITDVSNIDYIDIIWSNIKKDKRLEKLYDKESAVKSLLFIGDDNNRGIEILTDKDLLHSTLQDNVQDPIVAPTISTRNSTVDSRKEFVETHGTCIIRPVGANAYGGKDIIYTSDSKEVEKYIQKHVTNRPGSAYRSALISEYITDPLLLNNKKFHIRIYMCIYVHNNKGLKETGYSIYRDNGKIRGRIFTALSDYNIDDLDKDIHDTHIGTTVTNMFYPDALLNSSEIDRSEMYDIITDIDSQIDAICKNLYDISARYIKPYNESKNAFEICALDIMVRDDDSYTVVLLEVNNKVEYGDVDATSTSTSISEKTKVFSDSKYSDRHMSRSFQDFCESFTFWLCNDIFHILLPDIKCIKSANIHIDEKIDLETRSSNQGIAQEETFVEAYAGDRASLDIMTVSKTLEGRAAFKEFMGKLSSMDYDDSVKADIASIARQIPDIENLNHIWVIRAIAFKNEDDKNIKSYMQKLGIHDDVKKLMFYAYMKRFSER